MEGVRRAVQADRAEQVTGSWNSSRHVARLAITTSSNSTHQPQGGNSARVHPGSNRVSRKKRKTMSECVL